MSSLPKSTAIALLVLSLTLPAIASSNAPEREGPSAGHGAGSQRVRTACAASADCPTTGRPLGAIRRSADHRPGGAPPMAAEHPLDLALDGENDDRESIDPALIVGRIDGAWRSSERSRASAPVPRGFSEGLYGARSSRGPPLR